MQTILTYEEFLTALDKLRTAKTIAFDFETSGLNFHLDEVYGLALATDNGLNCYIPFQHNNVKTLSPEFLVERIKPVFESENTAIVAHNLKFDMQFLWNLGIDIGWKCDQGKAFDTLIMAWLINENLPSLSLKYLGKTLLKTKMAEFKEVTGGNSFIEIPLEEAAKYASLDALVTLHLYNQFYDKLEAENLFKVFSRVEMPFLKVLALMERRGVYVDDNLLSIYADRIKEEVQILYNEILRLAGKEFNINSGDQLACVLFEDFGAPVLSYTAGGTKPNKRGLVSPPKPQTDKTVIAQLARMEGNSWVEFCKSLLRYKELAKIDSTYVKGLRKLMSRDNKVYCNFNQAVTVTGRLSSSAPNLQNQPKDATWIDVYLPNHTYSSEQLYGYPSELCMPTLLEDVEKIFPRHDVREVVQPDGSVEFHVYRRIRDIYHNPYGVLIVADFDQMEMRVMGHFSQDVSLLSAFAQGVDVHKWVASHANKVPLESVSKPMRDKAKAVSFGTIYGKTVFGFANDWYGGESDFKDDSGRVRKKYLDKANEFLVDFFGAFGGIKQYIDTTAAYCRKYGHIKTLTGRKRRLPEIWSTEDYVRARAQRQAINAKIQGSAADYIKMAQISLEKHLEGTGVEQIIQIHDEIVFSAPSREIAEHVVPMIKNIMETTVKLNAAITTNPGVVNSWGQKK